MPYRFDPATGEPVNANAYRSERGFIVVREWLHDDGYPSTCRDSFHAASLTDTSSPWDCSGSGTGYDPACGWCWLGASHTADAHTSSLQRRRA